MNDKLICRSQALRACTMSLRVGSAFSTGGMLWRTRVGLFTAEIHGFSCSMNCCGVGRRMPSQSGCTFSGMPAPICKQKRLSQFLYSDCHFSFKLINSTSMSMAKNIACIAVKPNIIIIIIITINIQLSLAELKRTVRK